MPDHGKLTPWRFIVFEGEARTAAGEAIAAAFRAEYPDATAEQVDNRAQPARARAAGDRGGQPRRAACENSRMGAGALGRRRDDEPGHSPRTRSAIGANWITEWYAYDRDALDALGLCRTNEKIAGFVHIGTPAQPPEDRPRPPLAEIVTRFGDYEPRNPSVREGDHVLRNRKNDHGLPH